MWASGQAGSLPDSDHMRKCRQNAFYANYSTVSITFSKKVMIDVSLAPSLFNLLYKDRFEPCAACGKRILFVRGFNIKNTYFNLLLSLAGRSRSSISQV